MTDVRDRRRQAVRRCVYGEGELIIPAPVTAEIDYFLQERAGGHAAEEFILDLADRNYRVECLTAEDYHEVARLMRRYRSLSPGLADLSVVVLAARLNTTRVLTFDERHFRVMRPLQGGAFTILPSDDDEGDDA